MASSSKKRIEVVLALVTDGFTKGITKSKAALSKLGTTGGTALTKTDAGFKRVIASGNAYNSTLSNLSGSTGSLYSSTMKLAGLIGGAALFGAAGKSAISFNSTIENSRIGIAALIRTFTDADMGESFSQAEEIQKRLQIAGLETTATYEQLLRALNEGIGPALRENFNPAQVVEFTQSMTQAAAAISLPMDQLGQELRAILDGTIDRNARIAMALQIDNSMIAEWKAAGTLFENLQARLSEFATAGEQAAMTFSGAWSNVIDSIGMALGNASEQSFAKTTSLFLRLKDAIVTVDKATKTATFNEDIMAAFEGIDEAMSDVLDSMSTENLSEMLANFIETIGAVATAILNFIKMMMGIGEVLGPLGPIIAGVVVKMLLLQGAFKLVIGLPLMLYGQIKALGVGLNILTGGQAVVWLKSIGTACLAAVPGVRSLTAAFGVLALMAAAAMAAYKVGEWLVMGKLLRENAEAVAEYGRNTEKLNSRFKEISESTGVVVTSMEELDKAVANGEIHYDDLTGTWKAGAEEMAGATEDSADRQVDAQTGATDEMKKAYQEYVDKVKKLQDQIAGREVSLADKLRSLAQSGMDDASAWEDKKKQAEEYEAAARSAAEAGDFEKAIQLADKATSAYEALNGEVKNGDAVIVSQQKALQTAMTGVKSSGELAISILEKQKKAAVDAANALDSESGWTLSEEFGEVEAGLDVIDEKTGAMRKTIVKVGDTWVDTHKRNLTAGKISLEALQKLIDAMNGQEINVTTKNVPGRAMGGLIQKLATGGVAGWRDVTSGARLPGWGGGDKVQLMGEAGEVMINKDASRAAGYKAALAFNSQRWDVVVSEISKRFGNVMPHMQAGGALLPNFSLPSIPSIQGLQSGGVAVSAGISDTTNITFTFPSGNTVGPFNGSRALVRQIEREQKNMSMGRSS